jgi:hypothetical protein
MIFCAEDIQTRDTKPLPAVEPVLALLLQLHLLLRVYHLLARSTSLHQHVGLLVAGTHLDCCCLWTSS